MTKAFMILLQELFGEEGKESIVIPASGNKYNAAMLAQIIGIAKIENIPDASLEKRVSRVLPKENENENES